MFNSVYDTEYVPAAFSLAGDRKVLDGGSEPIYEIESSDILLSKQGPRRQKRAAGRAKCAPSLPIAATSSARSLPSRPDTPRLLEGRRRPKSRHFVVVALHMSNAVRS